MRTGFLLLRVDAMRWGLCVWMLALSGPALGLDAAGDRELRYVVPYIRRHDLPVTLGPTGAFGYVARHWIVVKGVHPGSPAETLLRPWDIVIGVNDTAFAEGSDPRVAVGRAITEAEAGRSGGALKLDVLRDGKRQRVEIPLRALGAYSSTWPFECKKSQTILAEACRFVADHSVPDRGTTGHREFNALLLLASGDIQYLDIVRRTAYRVLDDPLTSGYQGWSRSFAGILLAEYYLATGDPTVVPKLEGLAKATAAGQMLCGSWGHRMPWDGYGAVNQIGLMCFISLALFQEAGIEVDPRAMQRSADFFVKYAGRGWVPYGDHVPWRGTSGNGKNGSAAIVFDLLGGHERAVRDFAETVAASYRYREEGHTGAYFSFLWGPPGAWRASKASFRKFLDEQTWYYDLARTHDGGLVCQPNPENLSGRTPGTYTRWGPEWTTGGMALFYAIPLKTLRILGADKGVFAQRPPESLRPAVALWHGKKWDEAVARLRAIAAKRTAPAERAYAEGMLRAYERMEQSVTLTLKAVEANAQKGDVFLASEQLKALRRLLGEERPKMAELARSLGTEAVAAEIEVGKEYYNALRGYTSHARARRAMENLARRKDSYYGKLAAKALAEAGPLPEQPRWETLVPQSSEKPQEWHYAQSTTRQPGPGWQRPEYDDSKWPTGAGPFQARKGKGTHWTKQRIALRKTFDLADTDYGSLALILACDEGTEVYLNGYRLVEIISTPRRPDELVPLHDKAPELLRKGRNVLAVWSEKGRSGTLDVGLRAARPGRK